MKSLVVFFSYIQKSLLKIFFFIWIFIRILVNFLNSKKLKILGFLTSIYSNKNCLFKTTTIQFLR